MSKPTTTAPADTNGAPSAEPGSTPVVSAAPRAKRPYHRDNRGKRNVHKPKRDTYDPAIALHICERIAEGETLGAICATEGLPHRTTFRAWVVKHPELRQAYEGARELQAHSLYDEALDVARQLKAGDFTTSPAVNAAAKALEHLRWSAAKLNPAQYGERQNAAGVLTLQINTSLNLGPAGKEFGPGPGENLYSLKATLEIPTVEHATSDAQSAEAGPFANAVLIEGRPLDASTTGDGG